MLVADPAEADLPSRVEAGVERLRHLLVAAEPEVVGRVVTVAAVEGDRIEALDEEDLLRGLLVVEEVLEVPEVARVVEARDRVGATTEHAGPRRSSQPLVERRDLRGVRQLVEDRVQRLER